MQHKFALFLQKTNFLGVTGTLHVHRRSASNSDKMPHHQHIAFSLSGFTYLSVYHNATRLPAALFAFPRLGSGNVCCDPYPPANTPATDGGAPPYPFLRRNLKATGTTSGNLLFHYRRLPVARLQGVGAKRFRLPRRPRPSITPQFRVKSSKGPGAAPPISWSATIKKQRFAKTKHEQPVGRPPFGKLGIASQGTGVIMKIAAGDRRMQRFQKGFVSCAPVSKRMSP